MPGHSMTSISSSSTSSSYCLPSGIESSSCESSLTFCAALGGADAFGGARGGALVFGFRYAPSKPSSSDDLPVDISTLSAASSSFFGLAFYAALY